jgi:hypothetical protein
LLVRPSPHRVDVTAAAIRVSDYLARREPAGVSVQGPPLAPARSWCPRRRPSRLPSACLRSFGTEDGRGSGAARAAGIGGDPVDPAVTAHRAGTACSRVTPQPPTHRCSLRRCPRQCHTCASSRRPRLRRSRAHRPRKAAPDSAGKGHVDLPLDCMPWCSPTSTASSSPATPAEPHAAALLLCARRASVSARVPHTPDTRPKEACHLADPGRLLPARSRAADSDARPYSARYNSRSPTLGGSDYPSLSKHEPLTRRSRSNVR